MYIYTFKNWWYIYIYIYTYIYVYIYICIYTRSKVPILKCSSALGAQLTKVSLRLSLLRLHFLFLFLLVWKALRTWRGVLSWICTLIHAFRYDNVDRSLLLLSRSIYRSLLTLLLTLRADTHTHTLVLALRADTHTHTLVLALRADTHTHLCWPWAPTHTHTCAGLERRHTHTLVLALRADTHTHTHTHTHWCWRRADTPPLWTPCGLVFQVSQCGNAFFCSLLGLFLGLFWH